MEQKDIDNVVNTVRSGVYLPREKMDAKKELSLDKFLDKLEDDLDKEKIEKNIKIELEETFYLENIQAKFYLDNDGYYAVAIMENDKKTFLHFYNFYTVLDFVYQTGLSDYEYYVAVHIASFYMDVKDGDFE